MKLIISCGGTGGHFYPGLAIARLAKNEGHEVELYLGGHHQEAQAKKAAEYDLPCHIAFSGHRPQGKIKLIFFGLRALWATFQAFFYLRRKKADALLIMGSFAGVPIGLASRLTRTKLFLHEANTVPGKANRLLSRWAEKLFYSFPLQNQYPLHCPLELTGMPVRPELKQSEKTRAELCAQFGFDPLVPTVLAFGGSQGSMIINKTLKEAAEKLSKPLQVIHLIGPYDCSEYQEAYAQAGIKAHVAKYEEDMAKLYNIADLALCRSGASTLAELTLFSCPALFIPLKIAADQHQKFNALVAKEAGGAEMIEEKDFSAETLAEKLNELSQSPEGLKKLAEGMYSIAEKDSAKRALASILAK